MSTSMNDILEDQAYSDAALIIESAECDEDAIDELFLNGYVQSIEEADAMIHKHFFKDRQK